MSIREQSPVRRVCLTELTSRPLGLQPHNANAVKTVQRLHELEIICFSVISIFICYVFFEAMVRGTILFFSSFVAHKISLYC